MDWFLIFYLVNYTNICEDLILFDSIWYRRSRGFQRDWRGLLKLLPNWQFFLPIPELNLREDGFDLRHDSFVLGAGGREWDRKELIRAVVMICHIG